MNLYRFSSSGPCYATDGEEVELDAKGEYAHDHPLDVERDEIERVVFIGKRDDVYYAEEEENDIVACTVTEEDVEEPCKGLTGLWDLHSKLIEFVDCHKEKSGLEDHC